MDSPKWLSSDEASEPFDPERPLLRRERALATDATLSKAREILGAIVVRAVDESQIARPAHLERGLDEPPAVRRVVFFGTLVTGWGSERSQVASRERTRRLRACSSSSRSYAVVARRRC